MKRIYISCFLVVMLLCMFVTPVKAYDIEVVNSDGVTIYYNIIDNSELEVTYCVQPYEDNSYEYYGNVIIPESVNYKGTKYPVTRIGVQAFQMCVSLTSITIPNSVTYIGRNAFLGCSGLTNVIIPNSVTYIGRNAFYKCSGLTSFTIPSETTIEYSQDFYTFGGCDNLLNIKVRVTDYAAFCIFRSDKVVPYISGTTPKPIVLIDKDDKVITEFVIPEDVTSINRVFKNCTGLTSVTIPNSVTKLGWGAFSGCTGLTSVIIPNSVTRIDDDAFEGCSGLTSVTIPKSVTVIQETPFQGCHNLESITVEDGNPVYDSRNECNAIVETSTNRLVGGCKNTVIPNSVTSIGEDAFRDCTGLTSITIPNSVTSIGAYAFMACTGLTSITIPNSVTSIGAAAFDGCTGLTEITIPNSLTNIGGSVFNNTAWFDNQPNGLVYAGNLAYKYKGITPSNTKIALREGTVGIAVGAFAGCFGLTSITIPNSVTSIDAGAFTGCSGLTEITIPNSVTNIGQNVFQGCTGLTSITIPNSITSISQNAFLRCTGLTEITIPTSVTSIGAGAFSDCTGLTSITIPNSVTNIGERAFNSTAWFDNQPNGLVYAGNVAYKYKGTVPSNTKLALREGTVSISNYAFEGCGLTEITIPNSVTSISDYAFYKCYDLISVTIPNSVTSIGEHAFCKCYDLISVTIPNSVTTISRGAFEGCTGLTEITIPNSVTSISDFAFYQCSHLTSVTSLIEEPFKLSEFVFGYNNISVLYVPAFTLTAYQNTAGWNFSSTIKPITSNLTLQIENENGEKLNKNVNVAWYDKNKKEIGIGNTIGGANYGDTVYYSVTLNEELGRVYREVNMQDMVASDGTFVCRLAPIETVKITGQVLATGMEAPLADVAVTQRLNGKYEKTVQTKTDADGRFTIEAMDDVTELTIQYPGYMDYQLTRDRLGTGNLGTLCLEQVKGTVLTMNLSYQEAATQGEQPNVQNWYSDTRNIQYTLYNMKKGVVLTDFAMQQGDIVIPTGVDAGDRISVTAHSLKGDFADATAKVTVGADGTAEVNLLLKAYGGVDVHYSQKQDEQLLAMLYDVDGRLAASTTFSGYSTAFRQLQAGNYQLVTMGYNGGVGSVGNRSDLDALGLIEGTDYALSSVTVSDGMINQLYVSTVPELDASKFEYTSANTSYLPSRTQMTAGMLATMTARVAFLPQYAEHISNVRLVVTIPEGCTFIDNSVIVDNVSKPYTLNGGRLTISLTADEIDSHVRFCFLPMQGGTFSSTALAEFDYQGERAQTIGTAVFEATGEAIYAPLVTCEKNINVSGIAAPRSEVAIYDGGHLIGTTTAKKDGSWSADCELYSAYNLSSHEIYAQYRSPYQQAMVKTASVDCLYDINYPVAKSVTMNYYYRNIVFDLASSTCSDNFYSFVPSVPTFTFIADLTTNDTTSVSGVTFYVYTTQDNVRKIQGFFDEKLSRWVAVSKFDSYCLPVNVSVEVEANTEGIITLADAKQVSDAVNTLENIQEEAETEDEILDEIIARLENADLDKNIEKLDKALADLAVYLGTEYNGEVNMELPTEEEQNAFFEETDKFISEYSNVLKGFDNLDLRELNAEVTSFMNGVTITHAEGLTEEQLLEMGYEPIDKTDGTILFVKYSEISYSIVDINNDIVMTVEQETVNSRSLRAPSWWHWPPTREDLGHLCQDMKSLVDNICSVAEQILPQVNKIIKDNSKKIEENSTRYKQLVDKKGFSLSRIYYFERVKQLTTIQKRLCTLVEWLEKLKVGKVVGVAGSLYDLVNTINEALADIQKLDALSESIPVCKEISAEAASLRNSIDGHKAGTITYYACGAIADIASLGAAVAGIGLIPETAGISFAGVGASVAVMLVKTAADWVYNKQLNNFINGTEAKIEKLKRECTKEDDPEEPEEPEPEDNKKQEETVPKEQAPKPVTQNITPGIDPSGFVYEAVPTNRIKGVTATVYEQETGTTPWDAEEYSQVNPQVTDETGLYRWDVPMGNWQVRFVKEGYETTQTDWLPVPPPQLEINIPMTQGIASEVINAHGTESGITLTFSKYMRPQTVEQNGRLSAVIETPSPLRTEADAAKSGDAIRGRMDMVNLEEDPYTGNSYASVVKYVPAERPLKAGDVVLLTVKKDVESYCGVTMEGDQTLRVVIEPEIETVKCDSLIAVDYMETAELEITLLPVEASKGRKMTVESTSPMIASVEAPEIVFDDEGKARVVISGELPGEASIRLSMPDIDLNFNTQVSVVLPEKKVKTPKASKPTGSEVEKGYLLSLTSSTAGATIYYTLDGTDPTDEQQRIKYTGPIAIQQNITIKAVAVRNNMHDSNVATFKYFLDKKTMGDVDKNGVVDVADMALTINHVLKRTLQQEDVWYRMDMNADGKIDVGDVILIIKNILNQGGTVVVPAEARGHAETVDLTQYTAMQLNVVVPTGTKVSDIRLTGANGRTHQLMYQQTGDGCYTVVVFSMDNALFSSVEDSMLDVIIDGNGDVETVDVLLTTPTGERTLIDSLPKNVVTGIKMIDANGMATGDVYDLRGNKVLAEGTSLRRLPKGVYVINGRKVIK